MKTKSVINDPPPKKHNFPKNGQTNVGLISLGEQKLCHFKNSKQEMWWNSVKGWYNKLTWENNYIVVAMYFSTKVM